VIGACLTGAAAGCYVLWGVVIKRKGQEPIERLLVPERALLKALPLNLRRLLPY
jgi:hypothetical protein